MDTKIQKVEVQPVIQVLTTKDLSIRIQEETEQRALITEFITQHMKSGVDYGTISFTTKSGAVKESKPSLFKPGSEKFCSLFHFRPVFEKDSDTWEMSGKTPGLFCYKCQLIAGNGSIVGEGRGAAKLTEKMGWTENNAIKIAEKRAQIDAVLRTGGLSDFFTQDLEDMPKEQLSGEAEGHPRPSQESRPTQPLQGPITEPQTKAIFYNIKRLGASEEDLKKKFGIAHISELTKQEASNLITDLNKMKEWPIDIPE